MLVLIQRGVKKNMREWYKQNNRRSKSENKEMTEKIVKPCGIAQPYSGGLIVGRRQKGLSDSPKMTARQRIKKALDNSQPPPFLSRKWRPDR